MPDDLDEDDFSDRLDPAHTDEELARGLHGEQNTYVEGPHGTIHIGTNKQTDRPSVIMQAAPPVILNPAPVVVGKGYVVVVGLCLLIVLASQLYSGHRDANREVEHLTVLKEIRLDLERLRTPPFRASDTENGAFPHTPPKDK